MLKKRILLLFTVMGSFGLLIPGQANPSFSLDHFILIAHRGASFHAPEHTMEAYQLAETLAADFIEIDLQMTRDGVLVAMHDDKVDRTTNGKGLVSSYTLDELKELDAGSWFNKKYPKEASDSYVGAKVPTLEEIFQRFGNRVNYYIETKAQDNSGMEDKLLHLLNKYNLIGSRGNVVIQSFSKQSLLKIHETHPNLPLVQLVHPDEVSTLSDEKLEEMKSYSVGIGINYNELNKHLIKKIKAKNLFIHTYTVNDRDDFDRLKEWGVNGVFTDIVNLGRS
ncbi:glycerophosphodiester phosphodiesterase [Pueribacillus theae]|uniref:Glycerophosphodiester phosphodiesterase n=1 Tax=Pueribacillus theae TaxID=2171751 RepID=A0A2U1K6U4_9BACI|nr:glycerophosphodiester phosphodiesterase [Pueribacillus theae]PWA12889.1 glycerophosphodiester phosphodiesterase [Pueribacillus theae]